MRKKWLGVALMVFAFAAILFFVLNRPPPEPTYQGKTVSYWIKQTYAPPTSGRLPAYGDAQLKAKEAVQKIGTNGLPYYIHCLDARDSRLKLKLFSALDTWRRKHGKMPWDFYELTAARKHRTALFALSYLGTNPVSAAPALVRLLRDCSDMEKGQVIEMLVNTGPQSVSVLTNALSAGDYDFQREIVLALGGYGYHQVYNYYFYSEDNRAPYRDEIAANARVVVPFLIDYVNDTNKLFRDCALFSLASFYQDPYAESNAVPVFSKYSRSSSVNMRKYANMGLTYYVSSGSTNALNVLVDRLQDTDAQTRLEALITLGDCGLAARSAAPEIKKALNDPELHVRSAATNVLGRVKGSNLRFE